MLTRRPELSLSPLTKEIISSFYDVVHEVGCGFLEDVVSRATAHAMRDRGLFIETNLSFTVEFRGHEVGNFRPDIVVERLVIVEIKATASLEPWATAQLLNYLRCAGGGVGMLLNFGNRPEYKRLVSGTPQISLPSLPKDLVKDRLSLWLGPVDGADPASEAVPKNRVEPC